MMGGPEGGGGEDRDPGAAARAAVAGVVRRKRRRPLSYWVLYALTLIWLIIGLWKTEFSVFHPDAWLWFGTPLLVWIAYSAVQVWWPGEGASKE